MIFNYDRWEVARDLWADQCVELLYCGGSPEEQADVGVGQWIMHCIALIWKLVFLIVPPPMLGGGWPCFWSALFSIGLVTALAGDIASLLGCCLNIPDEITAITLVALGTSLPDTLASRSAAQSDDTADNAVGNVTGSNSVNVFLGCGISWTVGAAYWKRKGRTADWLLNTSGKAFEDAHSRYDSGFFMPTESLAAAVGIYFTCAAFCLALLAFRRLRYGGELGGPLRVTRRDSTLLMLLWVLFLAGVMTVSILVAQGQ